MRYDMIRLLPENEQWWVLTNKLELMSMTVRFLETIYSLPVRSFLPNHLFLGMSQNKDADTVMMQAYSHSCTSTALCDCRSKIAFRRLLAKWTVKMGMQRRKQQIIWGIRRIMIRQSALVATKRPHWTNSASLLFPINRLTRYAASIKRRLRMRVLVLAERHETHCAAQHTQK